MTWRVNAVLRTAAKYNLGDPRRRAGGRDCRYTSGVMRFTKMHGIGNDANGGEGNAELRSERRSLK